MQSGCPVNRSEDGVMAAIPLPRKEGRMRVRDRPINVGAGMRAVADMPSEPS